MFVREKSAPSGGKTYRYLQLVKNERIDGQVKQKVILSLGRKDQLEEEWVDQVVEALKDYTKKTQVLESVEEIKPKEAKNLGDVKVLPRLWEEVGLNRVIQKALQKRDYQFDIQAALKAVVFNRLINPGSELSISEWLKRDVHFSFTNSGALVLGQSGTSLVKFNGPDGVDHFQQQLLGSFQ